MIASKSHNKQIRDGHGCLGYPCPLGLKIYNSNLRDDRFNGYYIQTFSHSRKRFLRFQAMIDKLSILFYVSTIGKKDIFFQF